MDWVLLNCIATGKVSDSLLVSNDASCHCAHTHWSRLLKVIFCCQFIYLHGCEPVQTFNLPSEPTTICLLREFMVQESKCLSVYSMYSDVVCVFSFGCFRKGEVAGL